MMAFRIIVLVSGCIFLVANLVATVAGVTGVNRAGALCQALILAGLI